MAASRRLSLASLGEDGLLRILLKGAPRSSTLLLGPGDDCAVVQGGDAKHVTLLKTDCVVENVHFLRKHDPGRVGWKALCRPLSDIAAMGGEPSHALLTILSPPDLSPDYWKAFYRGFNRAARKYGVSLAGGETSRSAGQIVVSVALMGKARCAVTRAGGSPGDALYVTGKLGGSARGHHLDFLPRMAEGLWLAKRARAMMDLSDGLAADLPRLARASGCGFHLAESAVPRNTRCSIRQALTDGEDYELLFAISPRKSASLERDWHHTFPRLRLTAIGKLTAPNAVPDKLPRGFDHFSGCQKPGKPR